jgi:hypothetical protein
MLTLHELCEFSQRVISAIRAFWRFIEQMEVVVKSDKRCAGSERKRAQDQLGRHDD